MSSSDDNGFDPYKTLSEGFDFDYWMNLYQDDPEQFEINRAKLMDALLEQSPEDRKHRNEGLLFQIDGIRRTTKTPIKSCMEISSLMWDSLLRLNNSFNNIDAIASGEQTRNNSDDEEKHAADVLEFKTPGD